jgi:hypothetical protein
MGNCDIKRIKATKLCRGDLKHLVSLQTRSLEASGYDSSQPNEVFTTIREQWCAIETVSGVGQGVSRFSKIHILEESTHLFWTTWDSDFPDLENRNHWILYEGKRFKILRVDNINELNTTIVIQTTERGENSEEASEA